VTDRTGGPHAQLDRLLTLLREHGSGVAILRCRLDRAGVLHVEAKVELEVPPEGQTLTAGV